MPVARYWNGTAWTDLTVGGGAAVYEQPDDPGAVPTGSVWIDTDDPTPPVFNPLPVGTKMLGPFTTANSASIARNAEVTLADSPAGLAGIAPHIVLAQPHDGFYASYVTYRIASVTGTVTFYCARHDMPARDDVTVRFVYVVLVPA